jgi:hypothetical protein
MSPRHLVRIVLAGVLIGIALGLPWTPTPTQAAGVNVSSRNDDPDFHPDVAESPDGARLIAVWIVDKGNLDKDVRVATSTNGGGSWSGEAVIAEGKKGDYLQPARIIYDTTGVAHVVYMSGLGDSRTVYYRYLPAGADPAVSGNWRQGPVVCDECLNPDLAVDRAGNAYVLYEGSKGARHLGIRRVAGAGGAWGPARQISGGRPALRGAIAVTGDGKIHVAYLNVDDRDAYYARYTSYDNFTQEDRQVLSTDSETPDIAADNQNHVHIAYEEGDRVFYRELAGGLSAPVGVSAGGLGGAQNVTVAADAASNAFVSWTANNFKEVHQNKRVNGAWQGPIRPSDAGVTARYQEYGHSHRGVVFLMFIEGNITKVVNAATATGGKAAPADPAAPTATPKPAKTPTPKPPTRTPTPRPEPTATPAPQPDAGGGPNPPAGSPAERQPAPGGPSPDRLYFDETGHALAGGFKTFWEQNGGLPVFGFPLTIEFDELNGETQRWFTVQYLERQRFEYHPENAGTPYETLLGRLGVDDAGARGLLVHSPFERQQGVSDENCDFFEETGHRVCSDFRAYWHGYGLNLGDDGISPRESVALFGFPISEEFTDPDSGLTVQYFERAKFERHPENPPDQSVLLTRLGHELVRQRGW